MRISVAKSVLKTLIPQRLPVLLKGSPGIGKTDLVKQVAAELDYDLIIAHPVVDEPIDYKGLPFVVDGEARFLPFGNLRSIIEADRPTIYFLDDLGQSLPTVQAACMQLLLNRSINDHPVSDHVTFIAATNRREDKAGVSGILEPVKSRFVTILEINPDKDDWIEWAIEHDMPSELIAFIGWRPALLNDFRPTQDITNSPSPRTVANAGHIYNAIRHSEEFKDDRSRKFALHEAIKGACGDGFATEFMGFLDVYQSLPSLKEALENPDGVNMPGNDELSAQYAFACLLAEETPPHKDVAFIKLIKRMKSEFQMLTVRMAAQRNEELFQSTAVRRFLSENKELILSIMGTFRR